MQNERVTPQNNEVNNNIGNNNNNANGGTNKENDTTTGPENTNNTNNNTTIDETKKGPRSSQVYVPAYEVLTRREKKLVYIALCMGMFLAALDQLVVTIALPVIIQKLGGSKYLSWVIAAYLLTSSATMPLYGKYSDIYGRRVVYVFALAWFLIGSLCCGLSINIEELIASRAVQGIGGGGLMSLSMVLIGDIAKPAVRAKYMSSISAIFGLATVVGPIIGGGFTEYASWQWIFFLNVPFILITIVVSWFLLGKIKNAQKELPIDILGSSLIVLATVCLVLIVTWGGSTYAWSSYIIVSLIVVATILFLLFVLQELRHAEPIINFRLFRIRNYLISTLVMFLFGMAMLGAFAFVPFYFEDVQGDSAIISGFKIFPMVIGVMLCSTITGITISRTGKYIVFPVLGLAIFSLGTGLLVLLYVKTNYWLAAFFLFLVGAGMGFSFPVYNSIVQNSVPPQEMASSITALVFVRQIGGCLGVSIFGTIYTQDTITYYNKYNDFARAEAKALHHVFTGAVACALLGFVLAFGIENVQIFARKSKIAQNSTDLGAGAQPIQKSGTEEMNEVMIHAAAAL